MFSTLHSVANVKHYYNSKPNYILREQNENDDEIIMFGGENYDK